MDVNFSEGLNSFIGDYIITGTDADDLILNRESFIAPNGAISSVFTGSWGFHTNVGAVYNRVLKTDNDIYSFNANASFDLVPGGSEKGRRYAASSLVSGMKNALTVHTLCFHAVCGMLRVCAQTTTSNGSLTAPTLLV